MLRLTPLLCCWLTAATFAVPVESQPLDWARLDHLFHWGEFDSLTQILEPWSFQERKTEDSLSTARAFLYLGVSYHVLGDTVRGDSAFVNALRTHRAAELESHYVSPALVERFKNLSNKIPPISSPIITVAPHSVKTNENHSTSSSKTMWWALGGGGALLLGLGTYVAWTNFSQAPQSTLTVIDLR